MESDPELQQSVLLRRVVAGLISDKLAEMGVILRSQQLDSLYGNLNIGEIKSLQIDLDPEQEATLEAFRDSEADSLSIDIAEASPELLEE